MRRQVKRISRSEEEADINLTPMLDVVFIMLIFFIVTATFIKQAGIDVLRPEALTSEQKPTVALLVAISPGGDIWIDKKRVDPNSVRSHIERLYAENRAGLLCRPTERRPMKSSWLFLMRQSRRTARSGHFNRKQLSRYYGRSLRDDRRWPREL